jgi:pimeloyl-ACP methyl ester carboxylesterase
MTNGNLVFVHGIDGNCDQAEATTRSMFGKRYKIVTYDLIGRGKHLGTKPLKHDLKSYVSQLHMITKGLKDPFFLVGFSLGGAIAYSFAIKYPKRVRKIALVCPVVNKSIPWVSNIASKIPFPIWKEIVPQVMFSKISEAFDGVSKYKDYIEKKRILYEDARFIRVLYDTFQQFPFTKLQTVKIIQPLIIIGANSDSAISESSLREFAISTGGKLLLYEGDHSILTRKPAVIGSAIHNFFCD